MIEQTILSNLIYNDKYVREALPYIEASYFEQPSDQITFKLVSDYFKKYNSLPDKIQLQQELSEKALSATIYEQTKLTIDKLQDKYLESQWLLDQTERWCRKRAIHGALISGVTMFQDPKTTDDQFNAVPVMLQKALSLSFDSSIGHDYLVDAKDRYLYYTSALSRMPFDLEFFNLITDGGMPTQTLMVLLGGTGGGKTLTMCHMAAAALADGKNVLYLTYEMNDKEISRRIDYNLLDITKDELKMMSEEAFLSRIELLKGRTSGKLVVKQWAAKSTHAGHIRRLLDEAKRKQGIEFDVVFIDYINLVGSVSMKLGASNSYDYIKNVAEELRGVGVDYNTRIVSATQVNRDGFGKSEIDMTNTSDSIGIPFTADYMVALWATEEMKKLDQVAFSQLKNRYGDLLNPAKMYVGRNFGKMRLYDLQGDQAKFGSTHATPRNLDTALAGKAETMKQNADLRDKVEELFA